MGRTVWKFPLELIDEPQERQIPVGGAVIHVGEQDGLVCLWVDVEPDRPSSPRRFTVEGTGHPVHEDAEHVGSVITRGGALVWHVFEDPRGR